MNNKKCPECSQINVIKRGTQNGIQRWYCKDCKQIFQANKKSLPTKEELFCLYSFDKQTLNDLNQLYHIRVKVLQKMFEKVVIPKKVHNPRKVNLCIDATYFKKEFCVVVFRDQAKQECLWWEFTNTETLDSYIRGRVELEKLGYEIQSVVADGFPGIPGIFPLKPFQFCHFHAKKSISKYTTQNPKNQAGIDLLEIMDTIQSYNSDSFKVAIDNWITKYTGFLDEKTLHPNGLKSFTHKKLRSALNGLKRMSPYLFTYQKYPELNIPTTTNTLEGFFSHLKIRISTHRGLASDHKKKVVSLILLNSSNRWRKDMYLELFPNLKT